MSRFTNHGEKFMLNSVTASQGWLVKLFKSPTTDSDDEDFSMTECDYTNYGAQGFSFASATDTASPGTWYAVSTSNLTWTHGGTVASPGDDNTIYGWALWSGSGSPASDHPFYYEFFTSPITMTLGTQFSFVPRISLVGVEDVECE